MVVAKKKKEERRRNNCKLNAGNTSSTHGPAQQ